MRKINIEELKPGMVLAKTIFNASGKVLLSGGMVLNLNFIQRLVGLNIPAVYIRDEQLGSLEVPDVISDQTRMQAQKAVKDIFSGVLRYRRLDIGAAKNVVNSLVDELLANRQVLINLTDIRAHDDFVFGHSVNVAVLSLLTGISLAYNELQLQNLGVGALLHDLGKVKIDKKIMQNTQAWEEGDFEQYQLHTHYGFETLRAQGELSILSAHVAFQHHERVDGTGYPRGLKSTEIHEYSRIVAVANYYDKLTTETLGGKSYQFHEAVRKIVQLRGTYFDPEVTGAFLKNIAIYPIGSIVALSSGEIAIVVDNHKHYPMRPVVRIILDACRNKVTGLQEIDLAKADSVKLIQLLNEVDECLPSIQEVGRRI